MKESRWEKIFRFRCSYFILLSYHLLSFVTTGWKSENTLQQCPEQPLHDWNFDYPSVVMTTSGFNLGYQSPNCVVDEVSYEVFDFECIEPIQTAPLGAEALPLIDLDNAQPPILSDLSWIDEWEERSVLSIQVNPASIKNYPMVYTPRQQTSDNEKGMLNVCVRYYLWMNGIQVTFVDVSVSTVVVFSPPEASNRKLERLRKVKKPAIEPIVYGSSPDEEHRILYKHQDHSNKTEARNKDTGTNRDDSSNHTKPMKTLTPNRSSSTITDTNSNRSYAPRIEEQKQTKNIRYNSSRMLKPNDVACKETWGVSVFTCPNTYDFTRFDSPIETINEPLKRGKFLLLCIQLNDEALQDGAALHQVSELHYSLGTTAQQAIQNGKPSGDGLTSIRCDIRKGSIHQICKVQSLLYTSLFQSLGNGGEPALLPVDIRGRVEITSSKFGRRYPLELDFKLMVTVLTADDTSSTDTVQDLCFAGWLFLWLCTISLLFR